KVERSTDGTTFTQVATVGANVTAYSDTGLAAATQYYYRVRATNAAGDSAYSNVASATTPAPSATAPPKIGRAACTATASQINLTWLDITGNETGSKVERSTDGTTFTQVALVGANVTAYSDTGLAAATKYYYRVRATNAAGDSAYSNVASGTTPAPSGTGLP